MKQGKIKKNWNAWILISLISKPKLRAVKVRFSWTQLCTCVWDNETEDRLITVWWGIVGSENGMVGSENGIVGAKTGEFLQNLSPRPVPPAPFNTTWSKQMCPSKMYLKNSRVGNAKL